MRLMRSLRLAVCGALLAGPAVPAAALADDDDEEIRCRAKLSEAAEVPAPDPIFGTRGRARLDFDDDRGEASYRLRIDEGLRLFMAHIHCAPEGQTGPIVVWLTGQPPPPTGWDVDGTWVRDTTLDDADVFANVPRAGNNCPHEIADLWDLAAACLAGDCYVNVHSRDNPAGQVRGQLACKRDD